MQDGNDVPGDPASLPQGVLCGRRTEPFLDQIRDSGAIAEGPEAWPPLHLECRLDLNLAGTGLR